MIFFLQKKKTTVASWLLGQDYLVLPSFFLCVMANKAPQGVGGGVGPIKEKNDTDKRVGRCHSLVPSLSLSLFFSLFF